MVLRIKKSFPNNILVAIILSLSLISCSSLSTIEEEQATQPTTAQITKPSPTAEDVFQVEVWVDDPTPERGDPLMLYGSLIKHGVRLGGMTMQAYWPDEDQHPSLPDCKVQVIYGSGVCKIDTEDFPVGVPIPLKVEFDVEGKTYGGSLEITLH
jgi:hypothetical protein